MREARADIEFQSHDAPWLQVLAKRRHVNPSGVFSASALSSADKQTFIKTPDHIRTNSSSTWRGAAVVVERRRLGLLGRIGTSLSPPVLLLLLWSTWEEIVFEFNKHGNVNGLIRFW